MIPLVQIDSGIDQISYLVGTKRCPPGIKGTGAWRILSYNLVSIQIFFNTPKVIFFAVL